MNSVGPCPTHGRPATRGRRLATLLLISSVPSLGTFALLLVAPPALPQRLPPLAAGPLEVEQFVSSWLALGAWALVGWLTLGWLAALAGQLPGSAGTAAARLADAITPRLLRAAVELVLGATVAAAPLALSLPAAAATSPSPPWLVPATAPQPELPLPLLAPEQVPSLDEPVLRAVGAGGWGMTGHPRPPGQAGARPGSAPGDTVTVAPGDTVIVAPGDTLWGLTARALGPGASAARIAVEWPLLWRSNIALIGVEPNLLQPGEQLQVPVQLRSSPSSGAPSSAAPAISTPPIATRRSP